MTDRYVLQFDEENETFSKVSDSATLDTDRTSYLIIDENEKKMTMSYRAGISIVMKRKIERRVNSYSKSGFDIGGARIGLGFPLEQVNADEELPDILLTHGHTFGRRLERDEIPPHAENQGEFDVVPGSAGTKTDVSASAKKYTETVKTDVPSAMPEKKAEPAQVAESKPEPKPETKAPTTPSEPPAPVSTPAASSIELKANSSNTQSSDDAVWALGQFIDQFARQGKPCIVTFEESGKFRFVTLKGSTFSVEQGRVDGNYRIDDVNLFEL